MPNSVSLISSEAWHPSHVHLLIIVPWKHFSQQFLLYIRGICQIHVECASPTAPRVNVFIRQRRILRTTVADGSTASTGFKAIEIGSLTSILAVLTLERPVARRVKRLVFFIPKNVPNTMPAL